MRRESANTMARAHPTARRWLSIVALSLTGAVTVCIAVSAIGVPPRELRQLPTSALMAAMIGVVAIVLGRAHRRLGAFLGVRHFNHYPPLWIAWGLGAVGLLIAIAKREDLATAFEIDTIDRQNVLRVAQLGLLVLLLSVLFASTISRRWRRYAVGEATRPGDRTDAQVIPVEDLDFDSLRDWLKDDAPVAGPEQDLFGRGQIARRIASRAQGRHAPAQAVVGALGSGKSTLKNLVRNELIDSSRNGRREVDLIAVELWQFETTRAAVQGVIRALIEALAEEVSVLPLRGVPTAYAEAISAAGGLWSFLGRLHRSPTEPFQTLSAIDEIATAIGRRYVVWVEDLERFAGNEFDDQESIEDAERLNPIRALLLGLDRLESISVITATTTLHARFDLDKIARYVEVLSDVDERNAARILAVFRRGCLASYDVIDPAGGDARAHLNNLTNYDYSMRRRLGRDQIYTVGEAVTLLCATPRVMKRGLREVLDSWERLHGELDFDDLLLMGVVRHACPHAFAEIVKCSDDLRVQHRVVKPQEERPLDGLKSAELVPGDQLRSNAVIQIVNHVFNADRLEKPQGLGQIAHTDYWLRFLTVPELEERERDQVVLRTLSSGTDEQILALLESERSAAVEHFGRRLDGHRVLQLLVGLVTRRARESPGTWPDEGHEAPGLVPLWRMCIAQYDSARFKSKDALAVVLECIDAAIDNLTLAVQIERLFIARGGVRSILGDESLGLDATAAEHLRKRLANRYAGEPDALAATLRAAPRGVLKAVVWGVTRARADDFSGTPFARWSELAETVLTAARQSPESVLPHLADLVSIGRPIVGVRGGGRETRWEFRRDIAEELFEGAEKVLDIFRENDLSRWIDDGAVSAIATALEPESREGPPRE